MTENKYSTYLQISPTFESVVDLKADERNKNLWKEYIVTESTADYLDIVINSLRKKKAEDVKSFWVHGQYGTGKSYWAIVMKHLFEEPENVVDEWISSKAMLAPLRGRFMPIRENGQYLVIWQSGCTGVRTGSQLLMTMEMAIRAQLKIQFGEKANYGRGSLIQTVKEHLNDSSINWKALIRENDLLSADFEDVNDLRSAVNEGNMQVISTVAEVLSQKGWGMVRTIEDFKKWVKDIVEENHLEKTGILFFWDEFTDYMRYSDDKYVLQNLSEFTKECPFYAFYIIHKDSSWVDAFGEESYDRVVHRFHELVFRLPDESATDLIINSITRRPGVQESWSSACKQPVAKLNSHMGEMMELDNDPISSRKLLENLCPMHIMTVRLLTRVSQNFSAAQRTMFRFMRDSTNPDIGFMGYINTYGPEDEMCWLTPDWLWDYFFTHESDFRDKDSKAAEFIRHYHNSISIIENDAKSVAVFKCALLLMALMSSTGSLSFGSVFSRSTKDGISATRECLVKCFAGVLTSQQVDQYLKQFDTINILKQSQLHGGAIRLELPFNGGSKPIEAKKAELAKVYTRYKLFEKNGEFSKTIENLAWPSTDAVYKRMKIVSCAGDKSISSINTRIDEVNKELDRYPWKLGLVVVVPNSKEQYSTLQEQLKEYAREREDGRLMIAMLSSPLTDTIYDQWLTQKAEASLAQEDGKRASFDEKESIATAIFQRWVQPALATNIIAFIGDEQISNISGSSDLRRRIKNRMVSKLFPYGPEIIVETNTAYVPCTENAVQAGITLNGNSQSTNVILGLKEGDVVRAESIDELAVMDGNAKAISVAKVATFIKDKLESGARVRLSILWDELQQPPFGYYDTVACGVILGFVFRFYIGSSYTWTDEIQNTTGLNEKNLPGMLQKMCKGKLGQDYLSSGSVAWQQFRGYAQSLFKYSSSDEVANETKARANIRDKVNKTGVPYWTLKYTSENEYGGNNNKSVAIQIVNYVQTFIEGYDQQNVDDAMGKVKTLFAGKGKLKSLLADIYADSQKMANAFRTFIFDASPDLRDATISLNLQPVDLMDRIVRSMQSEVYTWTEEQVTEKLKDIALEYQILTAVDTATSQNFKTITEAQSSIKNSILLLRVPVEVIEELNVSWFDGLKALRNFTTMQMAKVEEHEKMLLLNQIRKDGKEAWKNINNAKLLLAKLLEQRDIPCSEDEVTSVYDALSSVRGYSEKPLFESALDRQLNRLKFNHDCSILKSIWAHHIDEEDIQKWSNEKGIPITWAVPADMIPAFRTLDDVQRGKKGNVTDKNVVEAISVMESFDWSALQSDDYLRNKFISRIGDELREIFTANEGEIRNRLISSLGPIVMNWEMRITDVQKVVRKYQQEVARKQKLQIAKEHVLNEDANALREKATAFLEQHPEYCDFFLA